MICTRALLSMLDLIHELIFINYLYSDILFKYRFRHLNKIICIRIFNLIFVL